MDISIPDHNLLDDGEHNLLDFDCKDFDDDVGISHSILNGDKQSPGSFAGEGSWVATPKTKTSGLIRCVSLPCPQKYRRGY